MRNKIIAGLLMGLVSLGSVAEEQRDPCLWVSNLAERIMKSRQNEVPMAKIMGVFSGGEAPDEIKKIMKDMVIDAYDSPAFSADVNKAKAVAKFQNEMYLACVKAT